MHGPAGGDVFGRNDAISVANYQDVTTTLEAIYGGLSPQLRLAARYVLDRPDDVALHTMRRLAALAGVHPTTMVRLARRMDYPGFNAFRDVFRERLSGARSRYSSRARALQQRRGQDGSLAEEVAAADLDNLRASFEAIGADRMQRCADILHGAERIYLIGLRGCFPVAFYLHYACSMFRDDVVLIDGAGGTLADEMRGVGSRDALIAISFSPYTRETVGVVNYAASHGARIIAITDSVLSPLASSAAEALIVRSDSPSFFQSITAAQSVAQALAALVVAGAGDEAIATLAERERQLDSFNAYWDDVPTRFGAQ